MVSIMKVTDLAAWTRNRWVLGGGLFAAGFISGGFVTWRRLKNKTEPPSESDNTTSRIQWCLLGVAGGVGATGLFLSLSRRLYPSSEQIFRRVLPLLRANLEVRGALGTNLQPGQFRAYAFTGGPRFSWRPPFFNWSKRQMEMMFQVNGQASSAMVSLNCSTSRLSRTSEPVFKSLAVDTPNGERILLKGQPQDVVFKGYTRLR